ncbi:MAG: TRAP transporter small permease [Deltaproteobacteria bacterium]|nr:TRAP transporter small permease [Deltaproteobacteria bacterium]
MQCLRCGVDFDPDKNGCPACAEKDRGKSRFARIMGRVEDILISFFLAVMVIVVLLQVGLRYFANSAVPGGDTLVRHLVLWVAFFGAAIATRSGSHVKIDALTRAMPEGLRPWSQVATNLFSAVVCSLLVYASWEFIHIEYQSGGSSGFAGLPVWTMEVIFPFGYALMAVRFARLAVVNIVSGFSGAGENSSC